MNFEFCIFGNPNDYNQYPSNNKSRQLNEFAISNKTDSQMTILRDGQLVYYSFIRKVSTDNYNYIGFCLIFNGVYCRNSKKLFELFEKTYNDVLLKGELLRFEKNGKISFIVNKFIEKEFEIERINDFFRIKISEEYNKDFASISSSFKIGNGEKKISIQNSNADIDAIIHQFDCVHIINNEKTISEMEHVYKICSKLENENQELNIKYKKLLGQKKQFKILVFLCFIISCCILCIVLFNKNIQSKESTIITLKNKNDNLNSENKTLIENNTSLNSQNIILIDKNVKLNDENKSLTIINSQLKSEKETLKENISNLNSTNLSLRSDLQEQIKLNNKLKGEISTVKNEISSISNTFPFKISKIEMANTDKDNKIINNYGNRLYANDIRYLKPKIYYTGYTNLKSIIVNYKIINPNGLISINSSISTQYTGSGTNINIYQGSNNVNLNGWGNATSSSYISGTYRIEIWYNDFCLGVKNFTIY